MVDGLIDVLADGLCAFAVGIERDLDGNGRLVLRKPEMTCANRCDHCQWQAEYLALIAMEYLGVINDPEQQSA